MLTWGPGKGPLWDIYIMQFQSSKNKDKALKVSWKKLSAEKNDNQIGNRISNT